MNHHFTELNLKDFLPMSRLMFPVELIYERYIQHGGIVVLIINIYCDTREVWSLDFNSALKLNFHKLSTRFFRVTYRSRHQKSAHVTDNFMN